MEMIYIPHATEAKHIMFQFTECQPIKLPRFHSFNLLLALWPAKISGWPKRPAYDPYIHKTICWTDMQGQ